MYCVPSSALFMFTLSAPTGCPAAAVCWKIPAFTSELNIGSPLSNDALPPPPVMANPAEIVQSPFLYRPWNDGMNGADAVPL